MTEPVHPQHPIDMAQDCLLKLEESYATDQQLLHAMRDVLRTMLTGGLAGHAPVAPQPIPPGMPGHPDYDLPTHSFGGTASSTADARLGPGAVSMADTEAIRERERAAAVTLGIAQRAQEQEVRDATVREREARDAAQREANERAAATQEQAVREARAKEMAVNEAVTKAQLRAKEEAAAREAAAKVPPVTRKP